MSVSDGPRRRTYRELYITLSLILYTAHVILQVEFDSPQELLKIVDGKLRAWVEESGDREALYAMARAERN